MVIADNEIKLKEIQARVVEDNLVFGNIEGISITSISRTLAKHRVRMKQLYKVPFERNSERIKVLRHQYVQVRLSNTVITVLYVVCFAVNYSINLGYSRTYSRYTAKHLHTLCLITFRESWSWRPIKPHMT